MRSRYSNEEIIAAYKATGSVWAAGKALGMAGQTIHKKLTALGYPMAHAAWTDDEIAELASLTEAGVRIGEIADRLGRSYAAVAVRASRAGLKSAAPRERKVPRGAGYDKVSTLRNMKELESCDLGVTRFARAKGLRVDNLVLALQKHCPERLEAYTRTHSTIPEKVCAYCGGTFFPANGKQRFCGRKCQSTSRSDADYFGGRRRETVGLAEATCQLCGRQGVPGLSSHHVFGKENDPDNNMLVALCRGCHKVITILGGRYFTDDETSWESLISLAWLRKHGDLYAAGQMEGLSLRVSVELEVYAADEVDELPTSA